MKRLIAPAAILVLAALYSSQEGGAQKEVAEPAPHPPAVDVSSCAVPSDAETNLPIEPYAQLPYFDGYSWHAFAALICAAKAGQRGVADPAAGKDGKGPRVFETFKSAWEVFHAGNVSSDWNSYENARYNPCRANAAAGDLVLASTSKFVDTEEVGEDVPLGPLPAQNHTYVHYLVQYNKISFEHIVQVLQGKTKDMEFPDGSVNVKSAWVEMKGLNRKGLNPNHFHVRKAWVRKFGGGCKKTRVGLVGLHIVQKTPSRPHWIWSTFEQMDNAPDDDGKCTPPGVPYTFNNKDCTKMPLTAPPQNTPYARPKVIFNVQRSFNLISLGTKDTNSQYQGKFAQDCKWRSYELVMTQWPIQDVPPQQAGDPQFTFPGSSTGSAFANTVMETFFQNDVDLSCMGCHAKVAGQSDFVWSLQIEPMKSRGSAFTQLRKTLVDAGILLQ